MKIHKTGGLLTGRIKDQVIKKLRATGETRYILGLDTSEGPGPSSRLVDLVRILIDESEEFRLLVPEIIVFNQYQDISRVVEFVGIQG